jgi:hypothetical protein
LTRFRARVGATGRNANGNAASTGEDPGRIIAILFRHACYNARKYIVRTLKQIIRRISVPYTKCSIAYLSDPVGKKERYLEASKVKGVVELASGAALARSGHQGIGQGSVWSNAKNM